MPGPRPKDPSSRSSRRRRSTAAKLDPAKVVDAPQLPDPPEDLESWHPLAVEWWEDLWSSPQAKRYTAMHKHQAYLALHTLQLFYASPTERLGQRVAVAMQGLGFDESDLRRLQWEVPIDEPDEPEPETKPARRKRSSSSSKRKPKKHVDPRRSHLRSVS